MTTARDRYERRALRRALAMTIAALACAALPAPASAEVASVDATLAEQGRGATTAPPEPPRVRIVAGAGPVLQVLQYQEAYSNAGPGIEAGIEAPAGRSRAHRLRLVGRLVAFHGAAAQLGLGSADVDWRFYPAERAGLHVGLGAGALLSHERIELVLGRRRVDGGQVRFGIPLTAVVGWTFGGRVDVDAGWRQIVFPSGEPATIGCALLTLGWRFP